VQFFLLDFYEQPLLQGWGTAIASVDLPYAGFDASLGGR
jgi:hypothetical protein